jgi:predicted aldo/keto reductase-like oxidoreductase
MKRRHFFSAAAAGYSLIEAGNVSPEVNSMESKISKLPKRKLGKTGISLSVIGLGGMVIKNVSQDAADMIVHDAIDAGVNYFDVAPSYGDAEIKLGVALGPYRKNVFLACKSTYRTRDEITGEMHESLKKLRTDYFDLYQLHALSTIEDVHKTISEKGALSGVVKAKEEGLVRLIGFSAHSVEAALEALRNFDFDTVLFPVNFVMVQNGNFGLQVIEAARKKGIGVLAIKSMAFTRLANEEHREFPNCWYQPLKEPDEINLALRFTLSHGVTSAITAGDQKLFNIALKSVKLEQSLTKKEKEDLRKKAEGVSPLFKYPE